MTAGGRRRAAAALTFVAWSGLAAAGDLPGKAAPATIFLSGHSLLDRPIPDDLAALLAAAGDPVAWDRHYLAGSSIRDRSSGTGIDREGRPVDPGRDVFAGREAPYDTLIVTEQHDLVAALLWNDSVAELRRLHDRFAARNPEGVTYFYVPWMAIDDKDDPRGWIAYERAAAPYWRCIAAAASDRIVPLPAASALAELIAAAIDGPGLPGLTRATARETVDLLVADDVHPTRLGSYYMALVVYAAITGRSPAGAWAPDAVPPAQARALQDFLARRRPESDAGPPDLDACAAALRGGGLDDLRAYMERAHWRKERGFLAARWTRLRQSASWQLLLWRRPDWNPFRPAG